MQLDQVHAVVTGATGGIGRAIAKRLHADGAGLLLTGRNEQALCAVRDELGPGKARVEVVQADLLSPIGVEAIRETARRFPGGINVLINNAGYNESGLFERITASDIEAIVAVNLLAPIRLAHALLPQLRAQPKSLILNIGSVFGCIGYPGNAPYSASKFGLRGFSEALRRELADTGVSVCHVAPRAVATSFNSPRVVALNRELGNREDTPLIVAEIVATAILDEGRETVIGQPERLFARINALLPGIVDGAIRKKLAVIKRHLGT